MQRRAQWLALGFSALVLTGCASNMGGQVDGGNEALSPSERRLQALETKVAQMQRRLDALNTTRFDDDNARLKDDMRTLRGDVEKARFDSQQSDRRSKDLLDNLNARVQRLEGGGVAASQPAAPMISAPVMSTPPGVTLPPRAPVAAAPVAGGAAVAAAPAAPQSSPEEEGAYLATFDLVQKGKYDDAIAGFQSMLSKWPNGRYADNAAYWMGEANYVKGDYASALSAFQMVVQKYPSSAKVPDAMLKTALSYNELKQPDMAKQTLQQLIQKYPNSNAAKLAAQKMNPPASKN